MSEVNEVMARLVTFNVFMSSDVNSQFKSRQRQRKSGIEDIEASVQQIKS